MLKVGMWVGIKSLEGPLSRKAQGCEGKRRAQAGRGPHLPVLRLVLVVGEL